MRARHLIGPQPFAPTQTDRRGTGRYRQQAFRPAVGPGNTGREIRELPYGLRVGSQCRGLRSSDFVDPQAPVRLRYAGGDVRNYVPEFSVGFFVCLARVVEVLTQHTLDFSSRVCMEYLSGRCLSSHKKTAQFLPAIAHAASRPSQGVIASQFA